MFVASPFLLGGAAVRVARGLRIPVVSIYQTDVVGFARRYRMQATESLIRMRLRRIHRSSDLTLAPSSASLEQLEELGIPRVRYWPRGVDTVRFSPAHRSEGRRRQLRDDAARAAGSAGRAGAPVLVDYAGRLAREKDLGDLRVLQTLPGVRLVLIGAGPEREALQAALPGALFLGARHGDDLAELIAALDVFVHTGAEETFCQAVQEALASGVPAVGPAAGGLRDRIVHRVNGLHYAPGDLDGLRSAVAELAADPSARRRMGRAAREGVESRSWEQVNATLVEHYREAAAGCGAEETIAEQERRRRGHYGSRGLYGVAV